MKLPMVLPRHLEAGDLVLVNSDHHAHECLMQTSDDSELLAVSVDGPDDLRCFLVPGTKYAVLSFANDLEPSDDLISTIKESTALYLVEAIELQSLVEKLNENGCEAVRIVHHDLATEVKVRMICKNTCRSVEFTVAL